MRKEALKCYPHEEHQIITQIQRENANVSIVTQNIDGMDQRADSDYLVELHGSLWKLRCEVDGKIFEDLKQGKYQSQNVIAVLGFVLTLFGFKIC